MGRKCEKSWNFDFSKDFEASDYKKMENEKPTSSNKKACSKKTAKSKKALKLAAHSKKVKSSPVVAYNDVPAVLPTPAPAVQAPVQAVAAPVEVPIEKPVLPVLDAIEGRKFSLMPLKLKQFTKLGEVLPHIQSMGWPLAGFSQIVALVLPVPIASLPDVKVIANNVVTGVADAARHSMSLDTWRLGHYVYPLSAVMNLKKGDKVDIEIPSCSLTAEDAKKASLLVADTATAATATTRSLGSIMSTLSGTLGPAVSSVLGNVQNQIMSQASGTLTSLVNTSKTGTRDFYGYNGYNGYYGMYPYSGSWYGYYYDGGECCYRGMEGVTVKPYGVQPLVTRDLSSLLPSGVSQVLSPVLQAVQTRDIPNSTCGCTATVTTQEPAILATTDDTRDMYDSGCLRCDNVYYDMYDNMWYCDGVAYPDMVFSNMCPQIYNYYRYYYYSSPNYWGRRWYWRNHRNYWNNGNWYHGRPWGHGDSQHGGGGRPHGGGGGGRPHGGGGGGRPHGGERPHGGGGRPHGGGGRPHGGGGGGGRPQGGGGRPHGGGGRPHGGGGGRRDIEEIDTSGNVYHFKTRPKYV